MASWLLLHNEIQKKEKERERALRKLLHLLLLFRESYVVEEILVLCFAASSIRACTLLLSQLQPLTACKLLLLLNWFHAASCSFYSSRSSRQSRDWAHCFYVVCVVACYYIPAICWTEKEERGGGWDGASAEP